MDKERWARLAADITAAAGKQVTVDTTPWERTTTHSITVRLSPDVLLCIEDAWHGNLTTWRGWQAWTENAGSIQTAYMGPSKNRGQVVVFVRAAVTAAGA
jgi:hypothetical protein